MKNSTRKQVQKFKVQKFKDQSANPYYTLPSGTA